MPRLTTQCGCVCERESLEIHLFSNEGSELKNEGSLQWMHYGCRRCMSVQCRQRRKCHQLRERERERETVSRMARHTHTRPILQGVRQCSTETEATAKHRQAWCQVCASFHRFFPSYHQEMANAGNWRSTGDRRAAVITDLLRGRLLIKSRALPSNDQQPISMC